jgi:hypothetical protein
LRNNNQVGRTGASGQLLDLIGDKFPGGPDDDDELEKQLKNKINYIEEKLEQEIED